jgi:hypothetical protein
MKRSWRFGDTMVFSPKGKMIIDMVKLAGLIQHRSAGRSFICVLSCFCLMSPGLLFAQLRKEPSQSPAATTHRVEGTASASAYKLEWSRHFQSQSGMSPVGAAEDSGTLWLITHAGPGKPRSSSPGLTQKAS